jgi:hypothetical protein
MEDLIQDCWTQDPTKRHSADKVVEQLQALRLVDERPPNEIRTSIFSLLLPTARSVSNQVDSPY